ncbi:MAG TPA: hypothetical protein VNO21_06980 [Polyangiaceae bacterium]|nr:hypothetical protein [Polyangiaceae bacterium]
MRLTYDAKENIVFVAHPKPVRLKSEQEVHNYFGKIVAFWRVTCDGRKAYFVVDYDNFIIDVNLKDFYARTVARGSKECVITVVRYGGEPLQRTVARLVGIQLHVPSNIYRSRTEAIEVVRSLRAKSGDRAM